MRDTRCKREVVEEGLNYLIGRINSNFENIEKFKKCTEEDVLAILNINFNSIIKSKLKIISYKYTLGFDLSELHREYLELIDQIDNVESRSGFFPSNIIALGILFEDGIERFQHLINLMD